MTIPAIDISPFVAGSSADRTAVAQRVGGAAADIGLFTISGHGVSDELVARMGEVSRAFFALPLAEKLAVGQPRPEQSRGYIGLGTETLAASRGDQGPSDLKEFFAIGPPDIPDEPYYRSAQAYPSFAPNVWPTNPAGFRRIWTDYYRALERLAATIMRIFAVALRLPPDFFADKTDRHISGLRALNYPAQLRPPQPGQLRAGPHTDYGAVSIVRSDRALGGLQVQDRRGEWVDVDAAPGCFVANLGDLMRRWTNDRWRSALHRVVNPPREAAATSRLSVVFFHQPNYDALIECLPTCTGADDPPRYPPVTSGEHRLQKFLKGVGAAYAG